MGCWQALGSLAAQEAPALTGSLTTTHDSGFLSVPKESQENHG